MKLLHILIIFILITFTSLGLAYIKASFFIITLLFILKFILVAFYFMEIKAAHAFWKIAILIFVAIFWGSVFLL